MLVGFAVGNYRSFREVTSLISTDESSKPANVSLVFGANSSGKTNLLRAIEAMSSMVRFNLSCWSPFKKDEESINEPSFFEVCILARSGDRLQYGFQVGRECVEHEWLYKIDSSDDSDTPVTLFERDHLGLIDGCHVDFFETDLFLNKISIPECVEIQEFFESTYTAFSTDTSFDRDVLNFVRSDPELNSCLCQLMSQIDLPIPDPVLNLPNSKGFDEALDFLSLLLFAKEKKIKLLAIDSFSQNLHPLLASKLIRIASSIAGLQLLVSTHQTKLMDEVPLYATWLIEKNNEQASILTGIMEYKVKNGHVSKAYLNGTCGGIPFLDIVIVD
jgi:AAA15 family ATPase/GTPase